ncbi:STM4015 family protein [Thermobifida halotolerans]|uniref:STM4015 family protein n=1 Tax=Thermobifida halotolerans TaxID=483545 RepID=A0A399G5I2_9ACTN|nr:STM4015 family protein [Thermobifida halotolerans]UOE19827.1 STM4015 family protein [Thermobifida halotolerans]
MPNHEHVAEFAGLPDGDFVTPEMERDWLWRMWRRAEYRGEPPPDPAGLDAARAAALADPGSVAWRLRVRLDHDREAFGRLFARFLDEVDTARVTALIVGCWGEGGDAALGAGARDLLVEHADRFPRLRALFFGEFVQEEAEISWILQTDVTPLLAAFPLLEEFAVRGGRDLEFPATRHTSLRRLVVQTGGLPREVTEGVLASDLPGLEHLELWFGVEDYGGDTTVDDLAPLLAGGLFPALRSLGLRNSEWGDELVRRLAEAPVLDRVRELDLSGHVLTDAGGEVLACAPAFRALKRLTVNHHYLGEEMRERIREALAGVDPELSEAEEPSVYGGEKHYYPEATE